MFRILNIKGTVLDKNQLEEMWESGQAPWKVWED